MSESESLGQTVKRLQGEKGVITQDLYKLRQENERLRKELTEAKKKLSRRRR